MPHTDPSDILRQFWGYSAFRPLQEDIIGAALADSDALALLPTGGGKSVCYQVPALCREGLCIVVSPLIALMKDQVEGLQKKGIPVAAVYSGMRRQDIDRIFENACNGAYKLLYVSPERLTTDLARERIKRMNVNLLAVDEAHCVSQWGYDFRPPYLRIAELRALIPRTPVLALTATATPEAARDIQEKLALRAPKVFQQSFLRSNLSYSVLYETNKRAKLYDILRRVPGSGVVYARSRGETKELAQFLSAKGVGADFYHAGLSAEDRSARQEAWMAGRTRVMVCTNAFGMGIDKPDVRIVVHTGLPDSLEAYFQEAGRAGRDGQRAYATLLYAPGDGDGLRFHLQAAFPPLDFVRKVYAALGSYTQLAVGAGLGESFDFDLQLFCSTYKLDQAQTHSALRLLEQDGWIAVSEAAAAPARVCITVGREALYDYQLRQRQADKVIKALLRAYPGIQVEPADISEGLIAKAAQMGVDAVVQTLQQARQEGILEYQPKSDKPQLVFTRERAAGENLSIDLEKFNFRRKRAEERTEQAIRYAENRRCRSRQLLAYFGEKDSEPCGICDVCTGRNKADMPDELFRSYEKKIRETLRHEPLDADELMSAFAMKRRETVTRALDFLAEEGKVIFNEDGKLCWVGG